MTKRKSTPELEPTYDVEYICKARVTEDEDWEYYIKWGGYPEDENSWEPEENLSGCRRMLKSFWEQAGPQTKSMIKMFPVDHEVTPAALWIARQRKAYRKTAAKKARLLARGMAVEEEEEEDEEEMVSKTSKISNNSQEGAYSDADDIPLSMKPKHRKAIYDTSSDAAPSASETTSTMKRKQSEGEGMKHHMGFGQKRLEAVLYPESATTSSQVGGKDKSSRSNSPSDSLFGDHTSESDTPLASKSIVPVPLASTKPKPTEPPDRTLTSGKSLPAHQQRKMNPLVKKMPLPLPHSRGPIGINTKARISGFTPGNVGQRSAESVLNSSSSSIRNPPSTTVASEVPKSLQPPASTDFDANKWLQENIVLPDSLNNSSALPSNTSNTSNLHFSKRWRWTGQLAVGDNESEDAFAEPVGGILLSDNTPLDRTTTSELGIQHLIPSHVDSICFRHSYPLSMLPAAVADFRINQFARMSANLTSEENSFSHLVAHMTKNELFSQTPLFIGDRNVATMFAFPGCFQYLWDQLGVPPKARQGQDLLVAIGFQIYEPPRGALGGLMETYPSDWKSHFKQDTVPESSSVDCSRALQVLTFPEVLYKRLAQKQCALFTAPADKDSPDTLALTTILKSAPGCDIVPILVGSARFIFIHVGAWDILHKLVGLVDRRRRRQDVQFYTYGSDPLVEPKHWGVHEVFPIGGVVTFTPRAIAEDPEGVEKLIGRLDEHPLWACYVLPSVVAMIIDVVKLDHGLKLKSVIDGLCGILMPIEKGQIALTWQPPSSRAWHKENAEDMELTPKSISWMIDQGHLSDLRGHELVVECQKRLQRSPDRTEKDVESRIVKDMLVMQSELRRVYRRFVIISDSTGASNASREAAVSTSASKADIKDGIEFTHMDQFTFGDDYTFADG